MARIIYVHMQTLSLLSTQSWATSLQLLWACFSSSCFTGPLRGVNETMHVSPQEMRPRVWAGDTARPGLWEPDGPLDGAEGGDRGGRGRAQNRAGRDCQGGLLGAGHLSSPLVTARGHESRVQGSLSTPPCPASLQQRRGRPRETHLCL